MLLRFTNLQCLYLFIEIRHPLDHLLSLLQPLTQAFHLLHVSDLNMEVINLHSEDFNLCLHM